MTTELSLTDEPRRRSASLCGLAAACAAPTVTTMALVRAHSALEAVGSGVRFWLQELMRDACPGSDRIAEPTNASPDLPGARSRARPLTVLPGRTVTPGAEELIARLRFWWSRTAVLNNREPLFDIPNQREVAGLAQPMRGALSTCASTPDRKRFAAHRPHAALPPDRGRVQRAPSRLIAPEPGIDTPQEAIVALFKATPEHFRPLIHHNHPSAGPRQKRSLAAHR